jgi:hypothetical protein
VRSAVLVAGLVALTAAGCLPEDDGGSGLVAVSESLRPPCVPTYRPGDQVTVQLGAAYVATSDYVWNGSLLPAEVAEETPSCTGADGLDTGSAVTFTLVAPSEGFGEGCKPFLAHFQPESLSPIGNGDQPDLDSLDEPLISGVSIAASFAEGALVGNQAVVTRALYTPSMDPNGTLAARQLPPLAVTREIKWNDDASRCFDAWVATPGSTP